LKVKQIYTSQIGVREKGLNTGPEVEKYLRYVHLSKGNPWCAAFVCWVLGQAGVENPRSGWSPSLFPGHKVIWQRGEPGARNQESRLPQSVPGGESRVKNHWEPGAKIQESRLPQREELRIKNQESRYGETNPKVFPSTSVDGIAPARRCAYPSSLATGNRQLATPGTGDIFGLYFHEKARIAHVGFIDQWDGTWMISVEGNTNVSGSREGDGVYRKRRLVRTVYKVARYIGMRETRYEK
jgi:hypothetical protein